MHVERALDLANKLVFESAGNSFNSLQEAIFKQAWEGKTYEVIAEQLGYSESHIKETGNELWKRLTEALSEKVTKKNFRAALERKQRSLQQQSDSANPQAANFPASVAITPHVAAPTTYTDPNFVGREEAIAQITSLASQGAKIITICAPGGVGKTTLAWQYLHTHGFDTILEIWMAKEIQSINSVESEVERWIQQNFGEEPGRDFGVNLERLRQKLRAPNQRIGILIDNLEPALDKNGRFIENRRPYVDLLRVLADPGARSLTLITSRERLCEPSVEIRDYRLEGLNETTWQVFFRSRNIKTNSSALKEMHHAYGGNAKAMQILSSIIQNDFDGDLEGFWRDNHANLLLNSTLENLVSEQFHRLQMIYPQAYNLLCRLGCHRYQDVPEVPLEAVLCLLWDMPDADRKRVVKYLQDRSLIEVKKSKYYLHPIIRTESIQRLKISHHWRKTNEVIAVFWTDHIKTIEVIDDALKAFEAYYHYLEIKEFKSAGRLIIKERKNKWVQFSSLGVSFYRLGLLQQIKLAINSIINDIESSYIVGNLYIILGDVNWMMGCLRQAIECHIQSEQTVVRHQNLIINTSEKSVDMMRRLSFQISSLFNRGLCNIDLWELEEAINLFESVYSFLGQNLHHYSSCQVKNSLFCLAFLYSHLGFSEKALYFAQKSEFMMLDSTEWGTGNKFFFLGKTYKNIGMNQKSFEMYHRVISYAEESHYVQAKARGLYGLAELFRHQENFRKSILHHLESIDLLEQIGAKCDLAEAYFQLGLTYQVMDEIEKGLEYHNKAIKLFTEMEAPKQVERVRLAFNGLEE